MNIYEYTRSFTPNMSDPLLLAKALADYNQKVWFRYQSKVQYLIDSEITEWNDNFDRHLPLKINDNNIVVDPAEIKSQLISFYNNEDDTEETDYMLLLTDIYSHKTYEISVYELTRLTSSYCDSLWLIYQGYNSIAINPDDPAAAFSGFVDKYINQDSDSSIIQTVEGIFSGLVNSTVSIIDKIECVGSFSGINLFISSTEESLSSSANIPLQEYTGVNPMIGFFGGIDIDFSSVASFLDGCIKAVSNVINNLFNTTIELFGGIFKRIGSWFTRTFVDPIDIEVLEGDTCEYYEVTTQLMSPLSFPGIGDPDGVLYNTLWNKLNNGVDENSKSITYNIAGQWITVSPVIIDGIKYLRAKIAIRPVDTIALSEIGKDFINIKTLKGFSSMMQQLQVSELSIAKGADEKQIYKGTIASHIIINYLMQILACVLYTGIANIPYFEDFNNILNVSLNELEETVISEDTWGAKFFNKLNAFMEFIEDADNNSASEYISFCSDHSIHNPSESISNTDFLVVSTSVGTWRVSDGSKTYTADITSSDNSRPYYGYIRARSGPTYGIEQNYPFSDGRVVVNAGSTQLTLLAILMELTENRYSSIEGVYIPYSRAYSPKFSQNLHIKSDQENIDAFKGFLKTTAIIGATIVAAYFGFKTTRAFLKNRTVLSAQLLSKKIALGNAYNNPRYTDEYRNNVLNQYKALRRKSRLFFTAAGTVGTGVLSKTDMFTTETDLSPVVKLIQ